MENSRRHRLVVCVDIEDFSSLSDTWQEVAQKGMYGALKHAFEACGLEPEYDPGDRGDGALMVMSANVSKGDLLANLPQVLADELVRHNEQEPQARVRLRVAVHAGEVAENEHGFVGDAVNMAFRLLDAEPLKAALAASPGVMALIVSEAIHHDVIRHIPATRPETYRRVEVKVKKTDTTGWICLPDAADRLDEILSARQVCPYRGLEPFTAEHTAWFHGRQTVVDNVLDELGQHRRSLLLQGPSGAGKSSLIQAGVLPALANGALPGSRRWLAVYARPRQDMLAELERAGLAGAATDGVAAAVERRLAAEPDYDRLVLVVDQFEELFTQLPVPSDGRLDSDPGPDGEPGTGAEAIAAREANRRVDPRTAAAAELAGLIGSKLPVTVVVVMRNDLSYRLADLTPELLDALPAKPVNVPATLTKTELRAIITRPAQAVGLRFDDGLPDQIITDLTVSSPSRRAPVTLLPALELALHQLWNERDGDRLTYTAYQRIGTVTGALATWCNNAIRRLPERRRDLAKSVLTSLVRPAEQANGLATRQQVPLSRLRELATDPGATAANGISDVDSAVKALADERIITISSRPQPIDNTGEPVAELIHDALLRDWDDLRDWIAQDHRFQAWLHRTTEQQNRYAESGDTGDLLTGTSLAEGLDWADQRPLPGDVTAYVTASHQHQQATTRRARRLNTILAALLTLTLIASGIGLWQWQSAVTSQHQAQSRQLAAQSAALVNTRPGLAALLAVEAHRISPTAEADDSLYTAAALPYRNRLAGTSGDVTSVAFSPDDKTLATNDEGGVRLWDLTHGTHRTLPGMSGHVSSLAFSPDGKILATAAKSGVRLWDLTHGTYWTLPGMPGHVTLVAFSPDGTLATNNKGGVRLWDLTHGTHRTLPGMSGDAASLAFSPDGKTLATNNKGDKVCLWDVAGGFSRIFEGTSGGSYSVAFSPDNTLAISDAGGVRLWHMPRGAPRTLPGTSSSVYSLAFSSDGRILTTMDASGRWQWRVVRFRDVSEAEQHICQLVHRDFTPEERSRYLGGQETAPVCPR